MTRTRTTFVATVWSVILTSSVLSVLSDNCQASTQYTTDSLWIRVDGQNIRVTFSGNWTDYANAEDCGTGAHRTASGSRYFAHAHIEYTLPANGTGTDGNPYTVTNPGIKAYWDDHYGKSSDGGEDCTYNCWGYALGYSTWIQDPS